jgi:hypothetical protein
MSGRPSVLTATGGVADAFPPLAGERVFFGGARRARRALISSGVALLTRATRADSELEEAIAITF